MSEKQTITYEQFKEAHEPQLVASAVPERFYETLYRKLHGEIFDAGEAFQIIVEENADAEETDNYAVRAIKRIDAADSNNIFLIDHAWTFRPCTARAALEEVPGLTQRMMEICGLRLEGVGDTDSCSDYIGSESGDAKPRDGDNATTAAAATAAGDEATDVDSDRASAAASTSNETDARMIAAVLANLWKHAQTYTIRVGGTKALDEASMPLWYIPDEFGARIGHSHADFNVRVVPFFDASLNNCAFSLLFPCKDIAIDAEVRRNYLEHALASRHPDWSECLMLPWTKKLDVDAPLVIAPKNEDYFMGGRLADHLPTSAQSGPARDRLGVLDTMRVYATDDQLLLYLRAVSVERVDSVDKADVLWLREHFHEFAELAEANPDALLNQFPYESALTCKDLICACVHAGDEFATSLAAAAADGAVIARPTWFPATFNCSEDLPAFITYYRRRQARDLDNTWIVKPWNLARGMDTHVTDNLDAIIRLAESGPKLVSKYIESPVLFRRPDSGRLVKFDLRYIVLVRSLDPLEVHVCNKFWPRCAINDFDLKTLDDQLSHLSVHNYAVKEKVLDIRCEEFISQLRALHPQIDWTSVEAQVDQVIKNVLQVASSQKPPRGMAPNRQSRAMYGFDLMLAWRSAEQRDVDVVFLEANFQPDCERACEFYETFADSVFRTLFLGGGDTNVRRI